MKPPPQDGLLRSCEQEQIRYWTGQWNQEQEHQKKQGLPQGSVLFLLFINHISKVIPDNVESTLFADNSSLYSEHTDLLVVQGRLPSRGLCCGTVEHRQQSGTEC